EGCRRHWRRFGRRSRSAVIFADPFGLDENHGTSRSALRPKASAPANRRSRCRVRARSVGGNRVPRPQARQRHGESHSLVVHELWVLVVGGFTALGPWRGRAGGGSVVESVC